MYMHMYNMYMLRIAVGSGGRILQSQPS